MNDGFQAPTNGRSRGLRIVSLAMLVCLLCTLLPTPAALAEDDPYIKVSVAGSLWKSGYNDADPTTQVAIRATTVGEIFRTGTSGYTGWYMVPLADGTEAWIKAGEVTAIGKDSAVLPDGINTVKITADANVVDSNKTTLGTVTKGTVLTAVSVYNGSDSSDCWYQVTDGATTGWVKYNEATALTLLEQVSAKVGSITKGGSTPTPTTAPSSAGGKSTDIVPSAIKVYTNLSKAVSLFTGETSGTGTVVSAPAGSYLQLVANTTYKSTDGNAYTSLYYNNTRYNVLYSDISAGIQTEAQTIEFIRTVIWPRTTYPKLKQVMGLVGDIDVHALQLALRVVGLYNNSLDGNFGDGTTSAVKAFQRSYKLETDGMAGPVTMAILYPLAIAGYTAGTGTGTTTKTGTITTTVSVNFRKKANKRAVRYGTIPAKTTLSYTDTATSGGVTWYQVSYAIRGKQRTGWVMGTYVSQGASGTSSGGVVAQVGTVTVTKKGTRVRKTPGGSKTGYTLGIGATVPLMSQPTTSGSYTWYYIKMSNGVMGYVRGDCATASISTTTPTTPGTTFTSPTYVQVNAATGVTLDSNGVTAVSIAKGALVQLENVNAYDIGGVKTYKIYYMSDIYRIPVSAVTVWTEAQVQKYITDIIWKDTTYGNKVAAKYAHLGDIYCQSVQYALKLLGYYSGTLTGTLTLSLGADTSAAIQNFQKNNSLEADGMAGPYTLKLLYPQALNALNGSGGGGTVVTGTFGTVSKVTRCSQSTFASKNVALPWFKSGRTYAVMDLNTRLVFNVRRIGAPDDQHPDFLPATYADTKILCQIMGFTGLGSDGAGPNSTQISKMASDKTGEIAWPDVGGWFGSKRLSDAKNYQRAMYINIDGTAVCCYVYSWPHGYNGFGTQNKGYASASNCYGALCMHVSGSKGHSPAVVSDTAQAYIDTAWKYATTVFPGVAIDATIH